MTASREDIPAATRHRWYNDVPFHMTVESMTMLMCEYQWTLTDLHEAACLAEVLYAERQAARWARTRKEYRE